MTNTLKTIQTFSKVARVLSTIVFVCCIVGVVGCVIGIVTLSLGLDTSIQIGDLTIKGLIEKEAGISVNAMNAIMICGIILCIGEGIIAKFAQCYFKNEIKAGTPFTFEGAKEMLRLGILTIVIPLCATIASSIVFAIMTKAFDDVDTIDFAGGTSIALGVTFIVISFLCKLGAEKDTPAE